MKFNILTLFPEMITAGLETSITGRGIKDGAISVNAVNIRDYTKDKHRHVDDYPYSGGAGMVMQAQPIWDSYKALFPNEDFSEFEGDAVANPDGTCKINVSKERGHRVVYLTPQGSVFNQEMARDFAKEEEITFLCGHYEGVDERILELIVTDNVSIGDYVLTGGELASMVMIDAISRLVPGVLGNEDSAVDESFSEENGLLEYPQYTRPENFMGLKVPEVLLSGHHKNILKWREEQSLKRTKERRPDLLENRDI